MYSSTKNIATIATVLSCINIAGCALLLLYLSSLNIPVGAYCGAAMYIVTSSAIFLTLSLALRKICDILEVDCSDNVKRFKDLSNGIKELKNSKNI